MKAEDIISFISVSERTISQYTSQLYYDIFNTSQKFIDTFKLNDKQTNAIYDYINNHSVMQGTVLYDRIKSFAENSDDVVTIGIYENDRYVVPATEIPKAYFQAIINDLNN